jgi:hypothetical protein
MTNSPISTARDAPSPLLHQSFISSQDEKKGLKKGRESLDYSRIPKAKALTQISKTPTALKKTKEKIKEKESQVAEENFNLIQTLSPEKLLQKARLEENPELLERVQEIEKKGKAKLHKMVEIFKEEALKTDQKLNELCNENRRLREILENPQLRLLKPSAVDVQSVLTYFSMFKAEKKFVSDVENFCMNCKKTVRKVEDFEGKVPHWIDCLDVKNEEIIMLLCVLSAKVAEEQKKRLKSEEETNKMIEWEEQHVKQLEEKIYQISLKSSKKAEISKKEGKISTVLEENEAKV